MRVLILSIFLGLFVLDLLSQNLTPEAFGFEAYSFEEKELGKVSYYLSQDTSSKQKPLLVYLDGSGPEPLFQEMGAGRFGSTVVINFQELSKSFRILLISKPGVPFVDKVLNDENGVPDYPAPEHYRQKLSLHWRVNTADLIIQRLAQKQEIDQSKIVVLGFSEGAQVAPFLARKNKSVSHLILFGGNGLNQFFDRIISTRLEASRGQVSEAKAQQQIDSLFNEFKAIYEEPTSTEKE